MNQADSTNPPNRKKRRQRILKKLLCAALWSLTFLLLLMLIGIGVLHIDAVQQRLKTLAIQKVEEQIGLDLTLGRITGNLFGHLIFEDVRISSAGAPLLRAERISVHYVLPALIKRVVSIRHLAFKNPRVLIARDQNNVWNFAPLYEKPIRSAPPASAASFKVYLKRITVAEGALSIADKASDRPPRRLDIRDIALDAALESGPPLVVRIGAAAFHLPEHSLNLKAMTGDIRFDPTADRLNVENLEMRTETSALVLGAEITGLKTTPAGFVSVDLPALSLQELGQVLALPVLDRGIVSGRITVSGSLNRLEHRLKLSLNRQALALSAVLTQPEEGGLDLDGTGTLTALNPADWPGMPDRLPRSDIQAEFSVSGRRLLRSDRRIDLQVRMGPGRLAEYPVQGGALDILLQGGVLTLKNLRLNAPDMEVRLTGHMENIDKGLGPASLRIAASVRDFDLDRPRLPRKSAGRLNADLQAEAAGILSAGKPIDYGDWQASALVKIKPSRVYDVDLRRGDVRAAWNGQTIQVRSLILDSDLLQTNLSGRFSPSDKAFRIGGRAVIEDLERLYIKLREQRLPLPAEPVPAGKINLQGTLRSDGAHTDISVDVHAESLQVERLRLHAAALSASVQAGAAGTFLAGKPIGFSAWRATTELHAERATVYGIDLRRVDVQGAWNGQSIEVASLKLASDLLQATLNGRFSPTDRNFHVEGRSVIGDLAGFYSRLQAMGLPLPAEPVPAGKARLNASIQSVDGRSEIVADLQMDDLQVERLRIDSAAISMSMQGGTDEKTLRVDRLQIKAIRGPDGMILPEVVNTEPIRAALHRDRLDIISLKLAAGQTRAAGKGHLTLEGKQDFTVELNDLDLNRLSFLWNATPEISGLLSLQTHLEGFLSSPQITADARLLGGRGAKFSFSDITARLTYANRRADWRVLAERAQRRIFELNGSTGLSLRLKPFETKLIPDSFKSRMTAEAVDLADLPLPDLFGFELKGWLHVDVAADGDIRRPRVHGRLGLRNGSLSSTRHALSYESVETDLIFTPEQVTIERLEMSGDRAGKLSGTGIIALEGLQPTRLDLQLDGKQVLLDWRRIARVKLDAQLRLAGQMTAPVVEGHIRINESRVDLDRLAEGGPAEIVIIDAPIGPDRRMVVVEEGAGRGGFYTALGADIRVEVPKNSWLKGQGLSAEIAGAIRLKKNAQGPLRLIGTLNTVRGNYEFQGRLFKITSGTVEFIGLEEPDPVLDIRAETNIGDVDILAHLTGSARRLELSLESDPAMEQADIVAYLVFGRSTEDLRWQQSTSAEIAALNLTGKIAAAEFQKVLGEVIGVDMLTFDLSGEDIRQGALAIGKYVTRDIFVTYRHGFATSDLGQIEVDYQINKNFSVQTQVGDELATGIDLIWQHDF